MDPAALLALIADLYSDLGRARRDLADAVETIKAMQAQIATQTEEEAPTQ